MSELARLDPPLRGWRERRGGEERRRERREVSRWQAV